MAVKRETYYILWSGEKCGRLGGMAHPLRIAARLAASPAGWGVTSKITEEGLMHHDFGGTSGNVDSATYDPVKREITVFFTHGAIGTRWDADENDWDGLLASSSPGNYVREHFNMLGYPDQP